MSAVVGVLNESLTESIKGFYKLRKAFITLDAILKMEEKFMQSKPPAGPKTASGRQGPTDDAMQENLPVSNGDTAMAVGSVDDNPLREKLSNLDLGRESADSPASTGASTPSSAQMLNHDPDSDTFGNQIDVFVHAGSNFCFGILLLLISMVPPAFSKLLNIIGFHGDKKRGLRMLWQASKFHNLIGGLSAFAILGYYNGFVRYCDIMPDATPGEDEDVEGYPRQRLEALLNDMRKRFPNSQLWLLEDSRMNGANKNLDKALELLCDEKKSPLQQVEALRVFERSLNAMYLHKYELCAESFLEVCPRRHPNCRETNLVSVLILILGPVPCITTLPEHPMSPYTGKPSRPTRKVRKTMLRRPRSTSARHLLWQGRSDSWRDSSRLMFL